jgi:hypothetical protein
MKDNIKMFLKGVECEIAYWIQLTKDKIQCQRHSEHSPQTQGISQ